MNANDTDEFKILLNSIYKNMPLHTENTFKIKHSFSQRIPKNMMEYSRKINNKFLNETLSIIEDIKNKDFKNWFRIYQNKTYSDSDILKHDGFFKKSSATINKIIKKDYSSNILACGFLINPSWFTVGSQPQSEILGVTQDSNNLGTGQSGDIFGVKSQSSATINNYFTQIAVRVNTAAGSISAGIYSDSSGSPDTLLGNIAVTTTLSGYNYYNLQSNATVTTATTWGFCRTNSNSTNFGGGTVSSTDGAYAITSWPFGSPNASWGTSGSRTAVPAMKWQGV